jgi:pilus assembly protein CpaB
MNIENKKQLVTILLAVGLGLIASMLMSKVVNDKIDQQTKIIAKEYQARSATLVKEIDATKQELARLTQEQQALAKRLAERPIIPAEVHKQETPPVQRSAFSLRTPPGKRALTVSISSLAAVGGLVNPGDFVDIIAHLKIPKEEESKDGTKEEIISVLFQNIQVLAVGTNYDPLGNIPAYEMQQKLSSLNVTFAVSPEEASLLTFAQTNGELQLALRSPAETQNKLLQQVASWDALADFVLESQGTELRTPKKKAGPAEEEVEEPKSFIQIFRGGREL